MTNGLVGIPILYVYNLYKCVRQISTRYDKSKNGKIINIGVRYFCIYTRNNQKSYKPLFAKHTVHQYE